MTFNVFLSKWQPNFNIHLVSPCAKKKTWSRDEHNMSLLRKRSRACMFFYKGNLIILGGVVIGPKYTMNTDNKVLCYNLATDVWDIAEFPGTF